ncbi:uncharacterized protein CG3556 [Copidosoma floridanum]|uniref:uncharacterized protein CG3556 n=1 Tax=Copidosoma floridanum TaxID=29053 RepID=UPI0006C9CD04|nr:uncharacterized protein CG3556 [Copidosoma floridanum]
MWGRANMAAVTLLLQLGWICIFARADGARGSGGPPKPQASDAHAMLDRAIDWLWSKRDRDAGWGNDTHRVLLALRMANLSRDDNTPQAPGLDMRLSAKQMELEIVTMLLRHREMGSSPTRLARYALTLNAMCMDPRQFHGHDLIGTIQHHELPIDYEFALTALAACSAQAHMRKRHMRRLLDITHTAQHHNIETVAMGITTLRCIVQDHRHRNLQHFVRKPSTNLAQRQRRDGGFGELRATAEAMQALEESENEPIANWNRSAALLWLAGRQRRDGSFDADVRTTAEVVLGLAPRKIASIRTLDCGQPATDGPPQQPRVVAAPGNHTAGEGLSTSPVLPTTAGSLRSTSPGSASSTTTTTTITTTTTSSSSSRVPVRFSGSVATTLAKFEESTLPSAYIIGQQHGQAPLVNVTYTLWVGSDVKEMYNLSISAPKNETFYEVMVLAAQRSPNFQFSAYEWPNGHYVHTLAGYKEEPMSYHYWLLYRLPTPPEAASPPGNTLVAPGGVDDLHISNGEHYLFWYKKL